jgi:ribonuclease PH
VLDVDYPEDSSGEADMNVVMSSDGGFIEVQGTGEARPMTRAELEAMIALAEKGCNELFAAQRAVLAG